MPIGDDVDVWFVRSDEVRDPAVLARCAAALTPDERERHDRFLFAKDRHQFLVTRGTIRTLLGACLDVDPAACRFEADRYGRPSLTHPDGAAITFNISHTAGLVACAIARAGEIGVDVEDTSRARHADVPRRFFSTAEADALAALPAHERQVRFYEYWTLKEAYIKARGMGLSLPLDGFSMLLDGGGSPRIRFLPSLPDDPASWQFAQFRPTPRHCLAVAVRRRGRDRAIHVGEFTLE
jgi:4'-phosphopantetheinyl transferase